MLTRRHFHGFYVFSCFYLAVGRAAGFRFAVNVFVILITIVVTVMRTLAHIVQGANIYTTLFTLPFCSCRVQLTVSLQQLIMLLMFFVFISLEKSG